MRYTKPSVKGETSNWCLRDVRWIEDLSRAPVFSFIFQRMLALYTLLRMLVTLEGEGIVRRQENLVIKPVCACFNSINSPFRT